MAARSHLPRHRRRRGLRARRRAARCEPDDGERPPFARSRAGATLTPAGERFLRHAPAPVQLRERARQQVAVPPGRRALLAVGAEPSLSDPLLLRWLLRMRRSLPDVALRAQPGPPDDLMGQVAEGILDIAVLYAPRCRAGLAVELLAEERLVMVTTPAADGAEPPGHVHVDWGAELAVRAGGCGPARRRFRAARPRLHPGGWGVRVFPPRGGPAAS